MGRYVTGDWKWKFELGEQNSSFGRIMEQICMNCSKCNCKREGPTNIRGELSEKIELDIKDPKEFINSCMKFIGNFKRKRLEENYPSKHGDLIFEKEYWDKLMIRTFLKDMKEDLYYKEILHFYVEH